MIAVVRFFFMKLFFPNFDEVCAVDGIKIYSMSFKIEEKRARLCPSFSDYLCCVTVFRSFLIYSCSIGNRLKNRYIFDFFRGKFKNVFI